MIFSNAMSHLDEQLHLQRYRRVPVVVEAVQVTHSNIQAIGEWIRGSGGACAGLDVVEAGPLADRMLRIGTLEGVMEARVGSWVVRGVEGEFYPVKNSVFLATFSPTD